MIRNTNVKGSRRPAAAKRAYASDLREQQTGATRTRILDALVLAMRDGVAGVSIPAVAREAGVSIPTVYRHFGSKNGLLAALAPYVGSKAGLIPAQFPETVDEVEAMTRGMFRNLASMDLPMRAAMASSFGQEIRQAGMPARIAAIRGMVDQIAPAASQADRGRLAQVTLILLASPTFRAYQDYLGLGPDRAAELVGWTIRMLVEGMRPRDGDGGSEGR